MFFGEKSKNRDKLIQFRTLGQHTKNLDYPGKIEIVAILAILYFGLLTMFLLSK